MVHKDQKTPQELGERVFDSIEKAKDFCRHTTLSGITNTANKLRRVQLMRTSNSLEEAVVKSLQVKILLGGDTLQWCSCESTCDN